MYVHYEQKNNSRVFIFGAGVSKAAAGAPVMKELFLKMKQRYEQEKKLSDPLVRNSRINEFKSIEAVINKLEGRTKKGLSESKGGKDIKIKADTGIRENSTVLPETAGGNQSGHSAGGDAAVRLPY